MKVRKPRFKMVTFYLFLKVFTRRYLFAKIIPSHLDYFWIFIIGVLMLSEFCLALSASRVVRTKYGDISGVIVTPDNRYLDAVEVFKGIPYASPPVGNLRFMPPVTGALWSGVKIADKFGPVCPQRLPEIRNETLALKVMPRGRIQYLKRLLPYLQNQSEDCLYLNVYAPVQAETRQTLTKSPVLVFIHGESFEWNSGNVYDGSVLSSYGGLVVVTVNYRLGILGFLNANTDPHLRSPTNYGLMDQIAALHWIQENIASFGGDPKNVTLVGHGTGAACVNFLMTSSAVPEGLLFHRSILMSGSALSPWALVKEPVHITRQIARHVNCSPELPHPHLLKCLREKPLESLLSAPIEAPQFSTIFGPSIDGVVIDYNSPDARNVNLQGAKDHNTHSEHAPSNVDKSGSQSSHESHGGIFGNLNSPEVRKNIISKLSRYDLLQGVVKAESFFTFNGDDILYGIENDRRTKILRTFVKNTYRYHLSEILATIINEYTDWDRPVQHPINIRDETLEALSDAQYVAPVIQTAELYSSVRRRSFFYVFDYQTKFGDYPQRQGCVHGEELGYVFGAPLVGGMMHFTRNYTKYEMLLSEATMIYWSNFARTGNPNEPHESEPVHGIRQERNRFKNIEWAPYEPIHKKYLSLDTKPKSKNHYRAHRLSFWLNLIPDLHKPGGEDIPRSHHQLAFDHHSHQSPTVTSTPKSSTHSTTQVTPTINKTTPPPTYESNSTFGIFLPPSVVVAPSSSERGQATDETSSNPAPEDDYAAYSTALSVTILIGCSLLLLNVLIFAVVYYQRDKNRHHHHYHSHEGNGNGSNGAPAFSNTTLKIRAENGGPVPNICVSGGATELLQIMDSRASNNVNSILKSSNRDAALLVLQPPHHGQRSFQSTDFGDHDSGTLPRPPPPPKSSKPTVPTPTTLSPEPKPPHPNPDSRTDEVTIITRN